MLYDLNWLQPGQQFPPVQECERIKNYADYLVMRRGDSKRLEAMKAYADRVRGYIDNQGQTKTYEIGLNYFSLNSEKTADLVCGEPPLVRAKEGDTVALNEMLNEIDFFNVFREVALDVDSLGDGLTRVYKGEKGCNEYMAVCPIGWYPVVDKENCKKVLYHVLTFINDLTPQIENQAAKSFKLTVQIHERGKYRNEEYELKYKSDQARGDFSRIMRMPVYEIGKKLAESTSIPTGLTDFAVRHFPNTRTSDTIFGTSSYEKFTSIVAELEVRFEQVARILDKHADPSPVLDESNFTWDDKGSHFNGGNALVGRKDGISPYYLVWDGQLTAAFAEIDKLLEQLYTLTEMGAIISNSAMGATQGYEALVTKMTSARLKARRIANGMTKNVKGLISDISKIGFKNLEANDISVSWNDGLPNDELRETQIAAQKKAYLSAHTIRKDYEGMTAEQSDEEAEKMLEEGATSGMTALGFSR